MADSSRESKRRATGPRSQAGKERSSQNARTHGCTARSLVLPSERQQDYEALVAEWLGDYQPQCATAYELVVETAQAHWFYLRVLGQCDRAERGCDGRQDPLQWSDAEWSLRERLGRYRTTAQRTFQRCLSALEARRRSRSAEQAQAEASLARAQRIELAHLARLEQCEREQQKIARQEARERAREEKTLGEARNAAERRETAERKQGEKKKKAERFWVAEQWVEVRPDAAGVTRTVLVPANAVLAQEIERRIEDGWGEPALVYRRLHFPAGVPEEYGWVHGHVPGECAVSQGGGWCERCQIAERGGYGVQRLCYATWVAMCAREAQSPEGRLGPAGEGNFPCPKELGGEVAFAELRRAWEVERAEDGEEEEIEEAEMEEAEERGPEGAD